MALTRIRSGADISVRTDTVDTTEAPMTGLIDILELINGRKPLRRIAKPTEQGPLSVLQFRPERPGEDIVSKALTTNAKYCYLLTPSLWTGLQKAL
jgi:hypothetical protein